MTIHVWRYAHLVLALVSCTILFVASLTGVILAIDAVNERSLPYCSDNFSEMTLAQSVPALKKVYPEIFEISIDHNQFVTLEGFDAEGNDVKSFVDPASGKILGQPIVKSAFVQWNLALHRSLFLKETGRFIVGVVSFLLMLIVISGTILIIKRQQGIKRFFTKVHNDFLAQYYHVVAGRLLLIPIFVLALTGTYLFLIRFEAITKPEVVTTEVTALENIDEDTRVPLSDFPVFKNIHLSEVAKIEFPFVEDPEEFYKIRLKDREIVVHQFSGDIISETKYPGTVIWEKLSLDLHTGRTNIFWAIILGIASLNILFFIYSGFVITFKRKAVKIRNKYSAKDAEYIILVGSENGSTISFANHIHQQILADGKKSFLAEMNQFETYPNGKHLLIFTSTYGLGDPPCNATEFITRLEKYSEQPDIQFSVIGFGSKAYEGYCAFAIKVDKLLSEQSWANRSLELHTVNDKSPEEFVIWAKAWSEKNMIALATAPGLYQQKVPDLKKIKVIQSAQMPESDTTFQVFLRPKSKVKFQSGDLLAIYPANDNRERFYSISKRGNNIQLVVKLHEFGLGSQYLYGLEQHSEIKARILHNPSFHFPQKAKKVIMIANGTGIAPFLGMIQENSKKIETHLYCGFRHNNQTAGNYQQFASEQISKQQLKSYQVSFSREENPAYVMDLIKKDADFFAETLSAGGILMICGALAMQKDVEAVLENVCREKSGKSFAAYKANGQVLSDCY